MSSIQDLQAQLRDLGQSLEAAVGNTYANAGARIVEEIKSSMRSSRMQQRTGQLYRSDGFVLQGDALVVSMRDYGYYQNFCVSGILNDPATEVTFGLAPKSGSKFSFTEGSLERARETAEANGGHLPGFIVERFYMGIRAKGFLHPDEWETILAEEFATGQIVAIVENTFSNTYII